MIDISSLKDADLVRLINNRWKESETLWSEIEKHYKENKRKWQNNPEWLDNLPKKKSSARDNRIFLSTETVISNLTGRPSKPNVIPANDTEDAVTIANNLHDYFLDQYRDLGVKRAIKKSLRRLFFSRIFVLKVFWNYETEDFDVKSCDPRKVRFNSKATSIKETDVLEEIEKTVCDLIDLFPEKEKKILNESGYATKEEAYIDGKKVVYHECWIGDYVIYKYKNEILKREPHPYWDWEGTLLMKDEYNKLGELNGARRRATAATVKKWQKIRKKLKEAGKDQYKQYFHNYLDNPVPPYIVGTVFEEEDKPTGDTSLIEQVSPLQEVVDTRKRQFSDNADMMNGVWKIDTQVTNISKQEAQKAKADPKGIWYGAGVRDGVVRETGKELPSFLFNDLNHSIAEIDNIFGTQSNFRGETKGNETATGRALLREQSYQRMNELIDLMDAVHEQLYAWWMQFICTRYTKLHLIKRLGADRATQTIDLIQDDIQDGIEVKVIPGQVMPEDRMFKAERAFEAAKNGLLDPLSYFEATDWENPKEQAKRLIMYKLNPMSLVDFTAEEKAKVQEGLPANNQPGQGGQGDQKAAAIAALRKKSEEIVNSPEFQQKSKEEQQAILDEIKNQFNNLVGANA